MASSIVQKKWKHDHFLTHREYYRSRNKRRRDSFKAIIREVKDGPCKRCGHKFHFSAMEFHHLGDKKFELSDLPHISSEKKLREEIAKCEIVCATCHKIITWMQVTGNVSPDGL